MTKLLEHAVDRVAHLSEAEQNQFAAFLLAELDPGPVPAWQLRLLAEREAEFEANPEEGIPLDEVMDELRRRRR